MAKIRCEAHNCNFNDNGGCRLESIRIEGDGAQTYDETLCDSYTDRTEHGFVNCTADRIDIGCESACCSSETECKTFKKE